MTTTNNEPSDPNTTIESNLNTPIPSTQPSSSSSSSSSADLIELILSKSDSIDLVYLDTLKKTKVEVLVCLPEGNQEEDVLDHTLDAGIHGFGYFVILSVRIGYGKFVSVEKILKQIKVFCSTVRKLHLQNLSIDLKGFVKSLIDFGNRYDVLFEVIEPIFNLISTLDEPELLTSLHSQLMKVALFTRDYKRAIELSNLDLIKINRKNHPIDYQDHLLYHYFAGIIQALNRNYKRSIQLLTIAVSAPGSSISQIQIEAYKKLILINLLYHHSNTSSSIHHHNLPKYTNPQFKNLFSKLGKVYLDLIGYFDNSINSLGTIEDEKLYGFVQKNLNCFLQDRNYGLVKLCIEVLPRRKITNLIPIYKSIPIPTISKILNEPNHPKLISLIRSMITTQEIHARIDESNQRLDFLNPPEPIFDFRQILGRIKAFENQMKEIEAGIERNPEYLKKTLKELKEMEKPMGGISGVGAGGLEVHHGLVQQQFLQQQQPQQQLGAVGEEDLGVGEENGWDEQDSFK